ncbi:MAG: hypothetical protein QG652_2 [Pseudomonadota bacterium]|nr:hypothetical protein [Pseudomonadota bacterium]
MNALVMLLSSLLFVASLAVLFWTRRHLSDMEQRLQKQYPQQFVDEITALNAGTVGMGGRFLKLEKELQSLASQLDDLGSQTQRNTPYAQAIQLAQKGNDVAVIMELCGISYNEAQLIVMMHAKRQAA